jgi:hypothetical protein
MQAERHCTLEPWSPHIPGVLAFRQLQNAGLRLILIAYMLDTADLKIIWLWTTSGFRSRYLCVFLRHRVACTITDDVGSGHVGVLNVLLGFEKGYMKIKTFCVVKHRFRCVAVFARRMMSRLKPRPHPH